MPPDPCLFWPERTRLVATGGLVQASGSSGTCATCLRAANRDPAAVQACLPAALRNVTADVTPPPSPPVPTATPSPPSLYLGHDGHLAETETRHDQSKVPVGFSAVAKQWDKLCAYIGEKPDGDAICNRGCSAPCGSPEDTYVRICTSSVLASLLASLRSTDPLIVHCVALDIHT